MRLLASKTSVRNLLPCVGLLLLGTPPLVASAETINVPLAEATPAPTATTPPPSPGRLRFSASAYAVGEGEAKATITIQRYDGSAGVVSVHYATDSGTAVQPGDYTATSGRIYFADGDTTPKTFIVPIVNDTLVEGDETVSLLLSESQGGAVLNSTLSKAVLTIKDNDTAPAPKPGRLRFSATAYDVTEGIEGATITVQRVDGTDGIVSVHYATVDGGAATAGADYTAKSGDITFAAGDAVAKTFRVFITDDTLVEPDEQLYLQLSEPKGGATLDTAYYRAALTIKDNDVAPAPKPGRLRFSATGYSVNEGAGTATITIQRVDGSDGVVSVHYATVDGGTATVASDYTATSGRIYFAAGDVAPKTFTVPIINDTVVESEEKLYLQLSEPQGGATLDTAYYKAALTIVDNDLADKTAPTVTFLRPLNATYVSNLNEIVGTAKDEGGSGLYRVTLQIRRLSDGLFWSGTAWVTNDPQLETTLTNGRWVRSSGNPTGDLLPAVQYAIRAYAYDNAGNRSAAIVQVIVDKTRPTLTLDNPAANAKLEKLPVISGTATDNVGIAKVDISIQRYSDGLYWSGSEWVARGVPLATTLDGTKWSRSGELPPNFYVASTQNPAEPYRVFARTYDKAGNSVALSHNFTLGVTTATDPSTTVAALPVPGHVG